ncbi:GNAT family N-acetyltransferase [Actinomadura yumaensis]|uniref:GNAT family N-acetyltransferase n=2 Tax=Actinomadura TaxID=1988 RepID=A0ABW2CIS8_9ACTN
MFEVREVAGLSELEDLYGVVDAVWRPGPDAAPVQVELLRALAHSGNYVAGAFEDGRMVGVSVGFLAAPPGVSLHSHITGAVRPGAGWALKLHQREWALARGLSRITWTFDPLVRRNAHFNLVKLGARPEEYLPSFYGAVEDSINGGDETDRVLAVWPLNDARVVAAVEGRREAVPDGAVALGERDGRPVRGEGGGATLLVAVPEDVRELRRRDRGLAREWRLAVRDVLGGLMADGARVTGFGPGGYVVEAP